MQFITEILKDDHDRVLSALDDMLSTSQSQDDTRRQLLDKVRDELELHTSFEEEVFYPEAREATGLDAEINDDLKEHREADMLLDRLSAMSSIGERWMDVAKDLRDALEHHIRDEQNELFPAAEKAIPSDRLQAMSRAYLARKNGEGYRQAG
ncbi:hemerythrin domain-containing protein [Minwuia thermotolerans]|nr:hemerythrin domain-containing protein [Minwuia thermotolerans]